MTIRRTTTPTLVVPAVATAALTGALIAAQSRFNGDLAVAGAGTLVAGWLSYVGTLGTVVVVVLARGRAATTARTVASRGRWWWFAIGLCGIPIVLAAAYGVPIVGVAVASVGSVAGQTVAGLLLDARGVGVPEPLPLTGRRLVAALVALGGLGLAMSGGSSGGVGLGTAVGIGLLFFVSGAALAAQNAGNGAVTQASGDPVIAGLTSATGGTVAVTLGVGVAAAVGALHGVTLPAAAGDWYRYLGGPLGAVIVVGAAWAVRHLGTFALTLTVIGGQLIAAMLVDLTRGLGTPWTTLASVAAIIASAALGVAPRRGAPR
jgi:transporter family-2 protein